MLDDWIKMELSVNNLSIIKMELDDAKNMVERMLFDTLLDFLIERMIFELELKLRFCNL